ncbi:MAG: Rieske (2Fe-2S) protein [Cyanobacteria bacterium SZAS TMP-1]|nr:Rieske (2Fe-2S) protein [Cyanobacteria bacterium SZAS TMP-1]
MEDPEKAKESDDEKKSCGKDKPCEGCDGSGKHENGHGNGHGNGDDEGIDRGTFMRGAFTTAVVCWGGMTLTPIFMYLAPPKSDGEEKSKVTSLEVCKLEELPKGTGRNFRFGSFPAIVIHTEDGQLHAFKAICTHLGCTVQFRAEKQNIYCACHGGEYDASTGKNIAGPPPKPLPPLKAEIVDGKIIVSRV